MKKFNCGQTVFVMKDNAPFETVITAKNTLDRYANKEVETKVEYFVRGIEREIPADEIFGSKEELLASFGAVKTLPSK